MAGLLFCAILMTVGKEKHFGRNSLTSFHFDDFVADQSQCELWKQGQEIKVRERTFRLLLFLIQHRNRAIGKAELMDHLWPDSHVTESSLFECINDARQVLGDSPKRSRYIQTVRKIGYKWVFNDVSVRTEPTGTGKKKIFASSLAAALLGLATLLFFLPTKTAPVHSIYIASIGSENDGDLRFGLLDLLRRRLEENLTYTVHCETREIPPTNLDQVREWAKKEVGAVDRILVIQVDIEEHQPHLRHVFMDSSHAAKKGYGPNTLLNTWTRFDHWLTEKAGLELPVSTIPAVEEFLEPYCQGYHAFQKRQFGKAKAHWAPLAQKESPPFLMENLAETLLYLNQPDEALVLAEKLVRHPQQKWRTSGFFFMAWCHLMRGDANYSESLTAFIQAKHNQQDFNGLQTLIEEHTNFLIRKKQYSEVLEIFEQNFDNLVMAEPSFNQPYLKLLETFAKQLKTEKQWPLFERCMRLCLRFPSVQDDVRVLVYTIRIAVRSLDQGGMRAEAIQLLKEFALFFKKRHPEDMGAYYYMETLIYYRWGDYEKALTLSELSLSAMETQDTPTESIKAMHSKSWLLFDLGFWDRATEQVLAAQELAIKSEHHRNIGDLNILLALIEHQKTGDWPATDELVGHVEKAGPLSILALLISIRGQELFRAITTQFQEHPNFPDGLNWVHPFLEGLRFRAQSQPKKAIDFFNQALEQAGDPVDEPWIHTNCPHLIAQTYAELGSWSSGLPFIQEIFTAYPQDFRNWSLLAQYYQYLGQPRQATSLLTKAKKRLGSAWRAEWDLADYEESASIK